MLHRTLPKLDLFTSAGELSEGDLASLADRWFSHSIGFLTTDLSILTVRDTDIIALVDPELSRIPAVPIPVPTLAQINPRPQLSEEDLIIPASTSKLIDTNNCNVIANTLFSSSRESLLLAIQFFCSQLRLNEFHRWLFTIGRDWLVAASTQEMGTSLFNN